MFLQRGLQTRLPRQGPSNRTEVQGGSPEKGREAQLSHRGCAPGQTSNVGHEAVNRSSCAPSVLLRRMCESLPSAQAEI